MRAGSYGEAKPRGGLWPLTPHHQQAKAWACVHGGGDHANCTIGTPAEGVPGPTALPTHLAPCVCGLSSGDRGRCRIDVILLENLTECVWGVCCRSGEPSDEV